MIEDPKFGVRRCLEGGLERCLDRLHVVWARTDHDEVKVASVIRTYSDYRVSIFLNIRTDICWCALHFHQRMSWCNSCPCCGGAVECMCQLLLGQLKAAGRPEVLKAGSLASRERSDSELGHWRNKLTGQRPPTRAGLGARQPSVGVIHTKFPRPAPSSSREKAHSSDPASTSAPNGTPSPLLPDTALLFSSQPHRHSPFSPTSQPLESTAHHVLGLAPRDRD